ncbi:MAG: outer membrane beta-barrel protein [Sedimentisphaerales bacterium]|nr:outer membrane beta-barrel protein [Sedimentisphaerales bacterium]
MMRTKSVFTSGQTRSRNRIANTPDDETVPLRRRRTVCLAVVLSLALAACAEGASGPGIGLKVGAQTLDHPLDGDKTTRARYELELCSGKFAGDHMDVAFTFGGSSLGTVSGEDAYWTVDDVWVEESYEDDLSVLDIRLAARYYPFGDNDGIQPYVGAGLGYFWFLDSWEDTYSETYDIYTDVYEDEDTEALGDGLFPFVLAGVTVPIGSNAELLFEFQYDFEKEDSGFDLGGPIYMAGARFRF